MKKTIKIIAAIVAIVLIGGILYVTNEFVGNPISKALAKRKMEEYIAENYDHLDLEIVETGYNFKFSNYYGLVQSKTSEDTRFYVDYRKGKIVSDDYSFMVEEKENTIQRLEKEYSKHIQKVISNELGYQENKSKVFYMTDENELKDYFELDMPFDPDLPVEARVFISVDLTEPSIKEVAKIIEDAYAAFNNNEYYFSEYGFENNNKDHYIYISDITPEEIKSGDLENILGNKDTYWENKKSVN